MRAIIAAGTTAPVGLFGETRTSARMPPPARIAARRSGSGRKPSSARQGKGTASMPCIDSAMRWLKYQGVGRITRSPGAASTVIAMAKARLQPAVMVMSAPVIGAP